MILVSWFIDAYIWKQRCDNYHENRANHGVSLKASVRREKQLL